MVWHDFKKEKPPCPGWYIWATSNWGTRNTDGQRIYSCHVQTAHFKYGKFGDYHDPDLWGDIPKPEPIKRPIDDLNFSI